MATFVGAYRDRMIERFEDLVTVGGQWLFNQFDYELFQRRYGFSIMMGRPRFVGVDEQTRVWRGGAHSFDAGNIAIVATEFQLENWHVPGSRGGIGHLRRRIKTDCERCLDLIGDWNIRQFPDALAGTFCLQVPQSTVQRIPGRTWLE